MNQGSSHDSVAEKWSTFLLPDLPFITFYHDLQEYLKTVHACTSQLLNTQMLQTQEGHGRFTPAFKHVGTTVLFEMLQLFPC